MTNVQVALLPPPLAGWEIVTDSNVDTVSVNTYSYGNFW